MNFKQSILRVPGILQLNTRNLIKSRWRDWPDETRQPARKRTVLILAEAWQDNHCPAEALWQMREAHMTADMTFLNRERSFFAVDALLADIQILYPVKE